MARDRARRPATPRLAPHDARPRGGASHNDAPTDPLRRSLIALGPFALGAAALLRPHRPTQAVSGASDLSPTEGEGRTAHQQAYYDRARF